MAEGSLDAEFAAGRGLPAKVGMGEHPAQLGAERISWCASAVPQTVALLAAHGDHLENACAGEALEDPLDGLHLHTDNAPHHPPFRDGFQGVHRSGMLAQVGDDRLLERVIGLSISHGRFFNSTVARVEPGRLSPDQASKAEEIATCRLEASNASGAESPQDFEGVLRESDVRCHAHFADSAVAGSAPPREG